MITMSKTFKIGNDLEVKRLGFGTMRLTGKGIWGEPKDPEEARHVLKRAVELGVNFIDTADSYGPDVSERLIGETLSPFPKGVVVATKGGLTRQGPDLWTPDGRPDYLAEEVEKSLRLLKTEVIDLWQLHRIDPKVPLEQSPRANREAETARQNPPHRPQRSEAQGHRPRPQSGRDRQRPEFVQRRRSPA